ncbi:MAG: hypothetical protein U1E50_06290 [Caulobacteraceae bacterium]
MIWLTKRMLPGLAIGAVFGVRAAWAGEVLTFAQFRARYVIALMTALPDCELLHVDGQIIEVQPDGSPESLSLDLTPAFAEYQDAAASLEQVIRRNVQLVVNIDHEAPIEARNLVVVIRATKTLDSEAARLGAPMATRPFVGELGLALAQKTRRNFKYIARRAIDDRLGLGEPELWSLAAENAILLQGSTSLEFGQNGVALVRCAPEMAGAVMLSNALQEQGVDAGQSTDALVILHSDFAFLAEDKPAARQQMFRLLRGLRNDPGLISHRLLKHHGEVWTEVTEVA